MVLVEQAPGKTTARAYDRTREYTGARHRTDDRTGRGARVIVSSMRGY